MTIENSILDIGCWTLDIQRMKISNVKFPISNVQVLEHRIERV